MNGYPNESSMQALTWQPDVHVIEPEGRKAPTAGNHPFGTDSGLVDYGWDTGGTGGTVDFGWNSKAVLKAVKHHAKLVASGTLAPEVPLKEVELQHCGLGGLTLTNDQEDCSEDLAAWVCALVDEE